MSKDTDQESNLASRQSFKSPPGDRVDSVTAESTLTQSILQRQKKDLDRQFQSLIEGVGAEIERIEAEQQARVDVFVEEQRRVEEGLRAQLTQLEGQRSQGKTRSPQSRAPEAPSNQDNGIARLPQLAALSSASVALAREKAMVEARLEDALRQNATLERCIDARTADLIGAERKIGSLEERINNTLEQSHRLKAELAAAQADLPVLFARLTERLLAFSRNANVREAVARDEAAAERLQAKQENAREALRAQQAIVRARSISQAARLMMENRGNSLAALTLSKLNDEIEEDGVYGAPLADPVAFLVDRSASVTSISIDPLFEIEGAMQWPPSEFVAAAYRWLLGREPDDEGVAVYSAQLRRGTLRQNVLVDIARSAEAVARLGGGSRAAGESDQDFLRAAYLELLGRAADPAGLAHYTEQLANGAARDAILRGIAASDEAQRKRTPAAIALIVICAVNRKGHRFRRSIHHWKPWVISARRHVSHSVRIAAIECFAARRNREMIGILDAMPALIEERVKKAYRLGRKQALATLPIAGGANSGSSALGFPEDIVGAKGGSPLVRLSGQKGSRTTSQIIDAIRSEIKQLELT